MRYQMRQKLFAFGDDFTIKDDAGRDVFFVDGGALPGYAGETPRSRLLRNDGGGRFVDVTDRSRIAVGSWGMGAIAGDVDGDGDLDLFVTAFGPDQLFRNDGDGGFTDVTAAAGVSDPAWSAGAAFADLEAKLRFLKRLFEENLITEQEYTAKKAQLLKDM